MLADKALKTMNVLCNKTRSFDFNMFTHFQLFDAFVDSILNLSRLDGSVVSVSDS